MKAKEILKADIATGTCPTVIVMMTRDYAYCWVGGVCTKELITFDNSVTFD